MAKLLLEGKEHLPSYGIPSDLLNLPGPLLFGPAEELTAEKTAVFARSSFPGFSKEFPNALPLTGRIKKGFWDDFEDWLLFKIAEKYGKIWRNGSFQQILTSNLDRSVRACQIRYKVLEKNFDPTPGSSFLWLKEDVRNLKWAVRKHKKAKEIDWPAVKKQLDHMLPKTLTEEQIRSKYYALRRENASLV